MLTRSRKKQAAEKDQRCRPNCNPNYSTAPGDGAVEVREMLAMDDGGVSGGLDDDLQPTDFLQVGEISESGLRSLRDTTASRDIVSEDPEELNPALWRTLPKDLLLHIFARLSVADITRLRSLSREWRRDLATVNSDINQACEKVNPPMVALLSHSSRDSFFVAVYDIQKWRLQYTYWLHLRRSWNDGRVQWQPSSWTTMDASDGGLVCFISLQKPGRANRLCILVVNILTQVQHELPPLLYKYSTPPAMVHIKVDPHSKCYRVVVVGFSRDTAETYDSGTRQWTKARPPSGFIFGTVQYWDTGAGNNGWCIKAYARPGKYDFGERKLMNYFHMPPSIEGSLIGLRRLNSVVAQGCMFVLHKQPMPHGIYGITEFRFDDPTKDWVRWKSYECPFLELLVMEGVSFTTLLKACDGFVTVIVHHGDECKCWVLDLSTSEWIELPIALDLSTSEWIELPKALENWHDKDDVLCRAFWNVIP